MLKIIEPNSREYRLKNIITLTELGDTANLRFTQMPYKVWSEPDSIKVDNGESYYSYTLGRYIQTKPTRIPISYLFANKKILGTDSPMQIDDELNENLMEEDFVKSRSSLNRSRQNVQHLCKLNFAPGDYFLTLTFKENITDIKKANEYFNKFNIRFNKYLKTRNAEYKWLLVYEYQQRGAVHFHIMLKNTINLDLQKLTVNKFKDGKWKGYQTVFKSNVIEKLWPYGFNTCLKIENRSFSEKDTIGKLSTYMSKYITKMFYDNNSETDEVSKYTKECKMKNINDYKSRLFRASKTLIRPVKKRLVTDYEHKMNVVIQELFQKKLYGGRKNDIKVETSDGTLKKIGYTINFEFDIESARLIFEYLCDSEKMKDENTFANGSTFDGLDLKIKGYVHNPTVTFSDDLQINLKLLKKQYAMKGGMLRRRYYEQNYYEKQKFHNRRLLDNTNITLTK